MDDDPAVRDSLALIISLGGFRVSCYTSGTAFLEANIADPPDCLVVDMHMPHLDGIELVQVLRTTNAELPVVLVSGKLNATIREQGATVGIKHFLKKPFSGLVLLDILRELTK